MGREDMFEHYTRERVVYSRKPEAEPHQKRCINCTVWANRKGITKDFWCKHMKHNLKYYR